MTDNYDYTIREAFEAECDVLVPDDSPLSEGFALKAGPGAEPIFVFRYADYAHLVRDWDRPEEEKEAALKEFWTIITRLATLGYGFHPIDDALSLQNALKPPCGQEFESQEITAPAEGNVL